jgi:hypothetical protein
MKKTLAILIFLIATASFTYWNSHHPANWTHAAVHPGMTVKEFFTLESQWSMCKFSTVPWEENNPHFVIFGGAGGFRLGSLSSYPEDKDKKEASLSSDGMAALVEKRMEESGKSWKAEVHFFGVMPRRVYFIMSFGPDRRVKNVSEMHWAD